MELTNKSQRNAKNLIRKHLTYILCTKKSNWT